MSPLLQSQIPGIPCRRGKVRDVYDLGDRLVIVATDRISAFDWVLPTGIPDKGRILTGLTLFWFDLPRGAEPPAQHRRGGDGPGVCRPGATTRGPDDAGAQGRGRADRVRGARLPGRLRLEGVSAARHGVRRVACRRGCSRAQQLPEPIFTPATKEESGPRRQHLVRARCARVSRDDRREELRERSLDIYRRAAEHARGRGIILADTKFEWGRLPDGELILIDEVLTPDSSRFWPADQYRPGAVRRRSTSSSCATGWRRPAGTRTARRRRCPPTSVARTRDKYLEAYERLTGKSSRQADNKTRCEGSIAGATIFLRATCSSLSC